MNSSINDSTQESLISLKQRVDVLLDNIDPIEDLDAETASTISITELSGVKLSELTRKFVILLHREEITTDEHRRLISDLAESSPTTRD